MLGSLRSPYGSPKKGENEGILGDPHRGLFRGPHAGHGNYGSSALKRNRVLKEFQRDQRVLKEFQEFQGGLKRGQKETNGLVHV